MFDPTLNEDNTFDMAEKQLEGSANGNGPRVLNVVLTENYTTLGPLVLNI